ncbi:hypothetical protein CUR178_08366 [Leishmania enriettii]|uniref:Uncharacterized protein n=1 Tax=Leishmania enriettii TaxID=5663 RepID=A0A836H8U1_LEIEN|nr:hypothetical protein CUR178_08366 [Leishmania enriettii]
MQTSTTDNSSTCSLNATTAEATAPVLANCATIAVDEVSENDAAARADAVSANTSVSISHHPLAPRDPKAAVKDTVDEGAPPLAAVPVTSEATLTKLLIMCLDRIHRLEAHQARGEAQQSMFDTSLQALLTQAHGQEKQSCGQAVFGAHQEHGAREANSSGAQARELNGQHHLSRQINSCHTSSGSHMNQALAIGSSCCITIDHRDSTHDRAAAATAPDSHVELCRRRHRQLHHTQVSNMRTAHSAETPAPSGLTTPVDVSAPAAPATGVVMGVIEKCDVRTNHGASSQHHHRHRSGAAAASGAAPSLSPADLANNKWKEASSGTGVGVGGGCARAVSSATAAGSQHHTPTVPATVASGSAVEPPMISQFGVSPSGGGRQRQGSLVTVVSPTHASQAEEAEAHAAAAAASMVSARAQVASGNAPASTPELICADVSSAPASATLMSGFTWAVPIAFLSSSENSRCSTPVEFHKTARPLSQQQHPTPPSAEEERSLCISRPSGERGNAVIHDGPGVASSVHQQELPLMLPQQPRGGRRHLRSSLTQLLPLADHPQQQQVRLHPHQPQRRSAEREGRESSSSSRAVITVSRSVGSTVANSSARTGDELDALYHALSSPHPSASLLASSGSAAASGGGATGTPPRKVQFPPGTDNNTAISELFAQTVQNTMETTNIKDNFAALVRSVHGEREKRRRLQRRVGSAVETLFRRVLAMSSVVSRLQRAVRRLELEASSSGAADAENWYQHHHHSNHRRRRGAGSNRSAGVSNQEEDSVACDGDVDDRENEWRERSCAFSAGSVTVSRSHKGSSSHRHSSGDRLSNADYASLVAPFPLSGSLSVGVERIAPVGRSQWLPPPTMRCAADGMHSEATLTRGGDTAGKGTATNAPVVDGVGVTSVEPAAPGVFSFERLAATTAVTATPAVSVGALLLTGSTVLPKFISSSSSLQSFMTTSAIITANVNTISATANCTTATAPSRVASAALVPQSVVPPLVGVPWQEHSPSSLLSPSAMLHACHTESRSSAPTSESPVVPTLSITDMRLGMALPLHASATEDEPGASRGAGRVSADTCAESWNSSTTPDGNACVGGRLKQRPEVSDTHHDSENVKKLQEAQGAQQHLVQEDQLRSQDESVEPAVASPAVSCGSSRRRRRERDGQRATPATSIPVAGGTQCSLSTARHPPPPPPRPTTPSRKSPASASAGKSSTAAGQALLGVQATPEKAGARRNSSGSTSVSARRLFDALHSEHRSGAVSEARTDVDVAAENSDGRVDGALRVAARGGRSALGNNGHSGGIGTCAVNATTAANVNSSAASLAPSMAALTPKGSAVGLASGMSNAATVTALPQSANTPTAAGSRPGQQRRGASVAKMSPGRRAARQSRSAYLSSAVTVPRSSADAAARRDDMRGGDACGTRATPEKDEERLAEATSAEAAGGAASHECANLPTWRNKAISVSPTHSSSDGSPSSHPQRSLLSSWLQSPPFRVATAAGGDDKITLLSPVTSSGAAVIVAGGKSQRRRSADVHQPYSSSGSTASTPLRQSNAQLDHTPATATALIARGTSFSTPHQQLQSVQSTVPIAVAHHPQQQLLQTAAASHQGRKWTSIHLQSSATVSGVLPSVPMAPSVPSTSSFLRIMPVLLSPSMAHPASAASPSASGSSASAGIATAGVSATASRLPALYAKPLSPLSCESRLDQRRHSHHLHPNQVLHFSTSTSGSSNNTKNASIAAPCMLAPEVSGDAAVQRQRVAIQSRCGATAFAQATASTLPSLTLSHSSSSRSPRLASSSASRRIKPVASASAASASSQPARLAHKADAAAMATVASCKGTQRTTSSARPSGEARQTLPPSSPVVHNPCRNFQRRRADSDHQEQRLQTPSLTRGNDSSRRSHASLPPPLSVETLSDASVSAVRTSSAGTTKSMEVGNNIGKGDVGGGTDGLAVPHHGGRICTALATLFADAAASRSQSYSTQQRPPPTRAGEEKNGRASSTPVALTAATTADVRGAICSVNSSCGTNGADVDRGASLGDDDVDVQAVSDDNDNSFTRQVPQRPRWQQQRQRRPRLGGVNGAEQSPARLSFLFDASTPVSMLSGALQRSSRPSHHHHHHHPQQRRLPAASGGGGSVDADIIHNVASHDATASSPHPSDPTTPPSSDKRSV